MSSKDEQDNQANQMNPNNDAYWQSRGYDERPDDWEEQQAKQGGTAGLGASSRRFEARSVTGHERPAPPVRRRPRRQQGSAHDAADPGGESLAQQQTLRLF